MKLFNGVYQGKRVLITGHTGFKGSWLALWLSKLGANIFGISLMPNTNPNHISLLGLDINEAICDIRNYENLYKELKKFDPEIIFHLAAQPLVRKSYKEPLETWTTNVMGTANILEASRYLSNLKAVIIVTTDKVYENKEWEWGYREVDSLGGHDPYSASKCGAEFVVQSYKKSFFNKLNSTKIVSARAGNVIGGGDWSEDRLIPDLVRGIYEKRSVEIRSPGSTRPWQHVLESLSGYLLLGDKLISNKDYIDTVWNFGPDDSGNATVENVLTTLKKSWNQLTWHVEDSNVNHETKLLKLDNSKAKYQLNWKPVWDLEKCLEKTASWYHEFTVSNKVISESQLQEYVANAKKDNNIWTI